MLLFPFFFLPKKKKKNAGQSVSVKFVYDHCQNYIIYLLVRNTFEATLCMSYQISVLFSTLICTQFLWSIDKYLGYDTPPLVLYGPYSSLEELFFLCC